MVAESTELRRLREQLNDAKSVRLKLEYDLEHTHAADSKKTKVIDELTEKLKKSETECHKVCALLHCNIGTGLLHNYRLHDLCHYVRADHHTEIL